MKTLKKITMIFALALELVLWIFNQMAAGGKFPDLNSGLALLAAYGWMTIGPILLVAVFAWERPKKKANHSKSQSTQQHSNTRQQQSRQHQPNAAEWWAQQANKDQFFADLDACHKSL